MHLGSTLVALSMLALAACDCTYEGSVEIPGDVHAFDPVAAAPAVQRFAGPGARLAKLVIQHCPASGLLDLEAAYYPGWTVPARYLFVRPTQAHVDPSLPVGARPEVAPTEGVEVEVMKDHWRHVSSNGSESDQHHRGMHASVESAPSDPPTALPACPLSRLWAVARTRGAPADAVATITYDATGYEFEIQGTPVALRFDASCAEVSASPDGARSGDPSDPLEQDQ